MKALVSSREAGQIARSFLPAAYLKHSKDVIALATKYHAAYEDKPIRSRIKTLRKVAKGEPVHDPNRLVNIAGGLAVEAPRLTPIGAVDKTKARTPIVKRGSKDSVIILHLNKDNLPQGKDDMIAQLGATANYIRDNPELRDRPSIVLATYPALGRMAARMFGFQELEATAFSVARNEHLRAYERAYNTVHGIEQTPPEEFAPAIAHATTEEFIQRWAPDSGEVAPLTSPAIEQLQQKHPEATAHPK